MSELLVWLLLVAALTIGAGALRRPEGTYEPVIPVCGVFLGFVWLQLHGLVESRQIEREATVSRVAGMALLCLLAFTMGHTLPRRRPVLRNRRFRVHRLQVAARTLTLAGGAFYFLLSRLPDAELLSSQPTGTVVAYRFFALTLTYGYALSITLFLYGRFRESAILITAASFFYLDRIIVAGRRAEAAEFVFIPLLLAFFLKRQSIGRPVMIAVVALMSFGMHSSAGYREIAAEVEWGVLGRLAELTPLEAVRDVYSTGGPEMRNAALAIDAYARTGSFDFGAYHWNQLVFNYVPAQVVGPEIKRWLTISAADAPFTRRGIGAPVGSTMTGIADSFGSFWYLGAIKFFLIGYCARMLWLRARLGSFSATLMYVLLFVPLLHTVTHSTQRVINPLVHMLVFLIPWLWWCRQKEHHNDNTHGNVLT